MSGSACFIWIPQYDRYCFGADHPLHPWRLKSTYDLLLEYGLLTPDEIVPAFPARQEDLLLVHSPDYIAAVKRAIPTCGSTHTRDGNLLAFGLGTEDNPIFPDMHAASCLPVGASLTGVQLILDGRCLHALNIGGGLHHAQSQKAAGFCIYNDAAIAIAHLRYRRGLRVAYVDIDAHHADGVQWAFYSDRHVLTISLHETGRFLFPGSGTVHERGVGAGYGYTVNAPLEPFTEDGSWQEVFLSVVPDLLRQFSPDILISQHGSDGHRYDPLAHLALTTDSFEVAARTLHALAHELCGGRWLALGGGGYDPGVVPRAWALLWAHMSGRGIPPALCDHPEDFPPMVRRTEIAAANRRMLETLRSGRHAAGSRPVPGGTD